MKQEINSGDFFTEAIDFLRESLSNYNDGKLKFSVLHAAMALEMALKERLVKVNPALVMENIDNPTDKHTVSLIKALRRLDNLGIEFNEEQQHLIKTISVWRGDVAHRKASFTEWKAREKLGAIYKLITTFCMKQLDTEISDVLSEEEYQQYKELLKVWDDLVEEAQQKAAEESYEWKVGSRTFDCPQCWVIDTVVIRNIEDNEAYCYLCNETYYYKDCLRCSEIVICVSDEDVICDGCSGWLASQ